MTDDRSDTGVRSVQLALDVLEAIAFSGEELGVTQLADRLKVTKGSVHRHLLTLVERGYLVQNPATTRYALGAKSCDPSSRTTSGCRPQRGSCAISVLGALSHRCR